MADLTAVAAAERAVVAAGVPRQAVNIILHAPFTPGARAEKRFVGRNATTMLVDDSITLKHRPTFGGLKIARVSAPGYQEARTLGFNAWADGSLVFITDSHCTNQMGRPVDTYFYQANTWDQSDLVGMEYRDPEWVDYTGDSNCPQNPLLRNPKCRYSDAAMVRYDDQSANTVWIGRIARTGSPSTGWGNSGSLIRDGSIPVWTITGTVDFPAVGDVLQKVGARTGWTYGGVSADCVDATEWVYGTYYQVYCQDFISGAYFGEGDSGAPVFHITPGTTNVDLYGVAWGSSPNTQETIFSAYWNVTYELGLMTTY